MKFKLPVRTRRALERGSLPRPRGPAGCIGGLDHTPLLGWGADPDGPVWPTPAPLDCAAVLAQIRRDTDGPRTDADGACACGTGTEVVKDGQYVCTKCGIVKDPVCVAAHAWHGTHTIIRQQTYDYLKYLDKHTLKLCGKIPYHCVRKIRAVFPVLYRAFFKVAPKRKNFMSYGFVLRKLLDLMRVPYDHALVPTIKTKSKVKACEGYWDEMLGLVDMSGL